MCQTNVHTQKAEAIILISDKRELKPPPQIQEVLHRVKVTYLQLTILSKDI